MSRFLPDPHAGPGQVRMAVHAAGVNASDWKKRKGLMDQELPQTQLEDGRSRKHQSWRGFALSTHHDGV